MVKTTTESHLILLCNKQKKSATFAASPRALTEVSRISTTDPHVLLQKPPWDVEIKEIKQMNSVLPSHLAATAAGAMESIGAAQQHFLTPHLNRRMSSLHQHERHPSAVKKQKTNQGKHCFPDSAVPNSAPFSHGFLFKASINTLFFCLINKTWISCQCLLQSAS